MCQTVDIIHSLIEWRFECDRLLSAATSVCLSSLTSKTSTTFYPLNNPVITKVLIVYADQWNAPAMPLCYSNTTSIPGYLTIFNLNFNSCRLPWFRGSFWWAYFFANRKPRVHRAHRRAPNSKLGYI